MKHSNKIQILWGGDPALLHQIASLDAAMEL